MSPPWKAWELEVADCPERAGNRSKSARDNRDTEIGRRTEANIKLPRPNCNLRAARACAGTLAPRAATAHAPATETGSGRLYRVGWAPLWPVAMRDLEEPGPRPTATPCGCVKPALETGNFREACGFAYRTGPGAGADFTSEKDAKCETLNWCASWYLLPKHGSYAPSTTWRVWGERDDIISHALFL